MINLSEVLKGAHERGATLQMHPADTPCRAIKVFEVAREEVGYLIPAGDGHRAHFLTPWEFTAYRDLCVAGVPAHEALQEVQSSEWDPLTPAERAQHQAEATAAHG